MLKQHGFEKGRQVCPLEGINQLVVLRGCEFKAQTSGLK